MTARDWVLWLWLGLCVSMLLFMAILVAYLVKICGGLF